MKNSLFPASTILALALTLSFALYADSINKGTSIEEPNSGTTDNSLCHSGKNQSPINIDSKTTIDIQNRGIKFNYGLIVPKTIKNTGKLIQIDIGTGTNIKVGGVEYALKHLDFHMPSENAVNGKHFPMEIQFIHENEKQELAYVSMMVIPGRPDRTLSKLLEQLPMNAGEVKPLVSNSLRNIEMKKKLGNYYQYNGSTTKPPCSEGVRWFIMKQPLTLSGEQQAQFKSALKQDNNRPVQPLNARQIIE